MSESERPARTSDRLLSTLDQRAQQRIQFVLRKPITIAPSMLVVTFGLNVNKRNNILSAGVRLVLARFTALRRRLRPLLRSNTFPRGLSRMAVADDEARPLYIYIDMYQPSPERAVGETVSEVAQ